MTILAYVIGGLGLAFGANAYWHLWRWAKQCQRARIAITYNNRVQLSAPLVEWLTWANMLKSDKASTGRVVYRNGKMSVAILRPSDKGTTAKTTVKKVKPKETV